MKITPQPKEPVTKSHAPHSWLSRRYRLPDATAKLIAELTFTAGVARAAERGVQ